MFVCVFPSAHSLVSRIQLLAELALGANLLVSQVWLMSALINNRMMGGRLQTCISVLLVSCYFTCSELLKFAMLMKKNT